jgi:chorismate synthase
MAGNVFGSVFRVITFGESHGPALGCVVDGCPAGVPLCAEDIALELRRRRPGTGGPAASARAETDTPEILSGVFEGRTLGTPVAVLVKNGDQKPADYGTLKDLYRPGHADWTWEAKYGFRDYRGGGRSSGRETVGRVAAGAMAKAFLAMYGIAVRAWSSQIAGIDAAGPNKEGFDLEEAERNSLRVPGKAAAERIGRRLEELASAGDSAGGIVSCSVTGIPPGLGEPVFGKITARVGEAVLSIGACRSVEFGEGFRAARQTGTAHNDAPFLPPASSVSGNESTGGAVFKTNHAGGSFGGISNGMEFVFRAAFKPTASVSAPQITVDAGGAEREIRIHGRHDVCIVPRTVPVVEAMTALVIADLMLQQRCARA